MPRKRYSLAELLKSADATKRLNADLTSAREGGPVGREDHLRDAIREGLESGAPGPLDVAEIKAIARRSLAGAPSKFARFSPDFMPIGRGDHDQAERDAAIDLDQAEARMAALRGRGYAISAGYDPMRARIVVDLSTGIQFVFPTKLVAALADASAESLAEIEISPTGLGLHWPTLDADVYLPGLIEERSKNVANTVDASEIDLVWQEAEDLYDDGVVRCEPNSEAERARRRWAVDTAVAGIAVPAAALAILELWVVGEIDRDECERRIREVAVR